MPNSPLRARSYFPGTQAPAPSCASPSISTPFSQGLQLPPCATVDKLVSCRGRLSEPRPPEQRHLISACISARENNAAERHKQQVQMLQVTDDRCHRRCSMWAAHTDRSEAASRTSVFPQTLTQGEVSKRGGTHVWGHTRRGRDPCPPGAVLPGAVLCLMTFGVCNSRYSTLAIGSYGYDHNNFFSLLQA